MYHGRDIYASYSWDITLVWIVVAGCGEDESVVSAEPDKTGTIVIDPEPNSIDAPWELSGPNSYIASSSGDTTMTSMEPGEYRLTWEKVNGYLTPSGDTITLASNEVITFSVTYVRGTGMIVMDQTPGFLSGAFWTLNGPQDRTGAGDAILRNMPTGTYTLSWRDVSLYNTPDSETKNLSANDTIVFVGTYEYANPLITGSVDTPGQAFDVSVSGSYAYVADWNSLQLIDISTPSLPVIVGSVETPGDAVGVEASGSYAYVAELDYSLVTELDYGLQVVDIIRPSSPVIVGSVDTPGYGQGVAVEGSYAYVADSQHGLHVIDISTPSSPVIVGSVDTPGSAWGVAVSGSYAYVADRHSGLQVVDISAPSSPVIVGSIDTPGIAKGVAVSGSYVYIADEGSGLQVVDVSAPSSPVIVGAVDTPGSANDVTVSGSYAYIADEWYGLQVVDISAPSSPVIVGSIDTPGSAKGVAVSGSYAYVADRTFGLHVIDISTPFSR